jgi:hypothetical protein
MVATTISITSAGVISHIFPRSPVVSFQRWHRAHLVDTPPAPPPQPLPPPPLPSPPPPSLLIRRISLLLQPTHLFRVCHSNQALPPPTFSFPPSPCISSSPPPPLCPNCSCTCSLHLSLPPPPPPSLESYTPTSHAKSIRFPVAFPSPLLHSPAQCMSRAGHTSHVTRHTSHVTRHTSHVTRHTSLLLCMPRPTHSSTHHAPWLPL